MHGPDCYHQHRLLSFRPMEQLFIYITYKSLGQLKSNQQQSELFSVTSDLFLSPVSWEAPLPLTHVLSKVSGSHP